MHEIPNEPCHASAPKLKEETVVVGPSNGLANVLVWIEGAPKSAPTTQQAQVLDQVHCRYVPHVLGIVAGQELRIRSSDDTLHNVHMTASKNDSRNFGMTAANQERTVKLDQAEFDPPIRVKCDVHPWMTAYVAVMDNPFFAVTGEDGSFELAKLPPGNYKLLAWHELYGRLEQPITVSDEKPVQMSFVYKQ